MSKNIFHERKILFLILDDIRFCSLRDFYAHVYSKYFEKKVAYPSCCIGFEMNSCEFARTTIDVHSTTSLFVRSEEHEQEMLSTSFDVTVVKDTTSRERRG